MKYQVAIIGGGPAGYTAAEAAGKAGLSVVLFEKQSLGGVCLNEGCIPTKTLLYSAKTYDGARHAAKYAVSVPEVSFDLPKIIARKQKVVRKLVLGVKGKLTAHGVTIVSGEATVTDKNHVECGGETYECENLLLCTGSETFVPAIPGIDKVSCHHRRRCHRYGVRFFLQQPGSAGNRRRDAGRDTGRRYGPRAGGYAPCRVRQAGNQVHAECKSSVCHAGYCRSFFPYPGEL